MKDDSLIKCGCFFVWVIVCFFVGSYTLNYLLLTFFGKGLPFFWAGVVGIFTAEFTVPLAILVYVLKLFGVI